MFKTLMAAIEPVAPSKWRFGTMAVGASALDSAFAKPPCCDDSIRIRPWGDGLEVRPIRQECTDDNRPIFGRSSRHDRPGHPTVQRPETQMRGALPGEIIIGMRVFLAGNDDVGTVEHRWRRIGMQVKADRNREVPAYSLAQRGDEIALDVVD